MNIYLVRHGTTEWNMEHKIQGSVDTRLDETGRKMAEMTASALEKEGIRFALVFSSPLRRAYETASVLSNGADIITDERLRELDFGPFEGQKTDDMMSDPDCFFKYFKTAPSIYNDYCIKSGALPDCSCESLASLCERAADFLKSSIEPLSCKLPDSENILISGHGALNRALMMHMRGEKDLSLFWGKGLQANCGITVIKCEKKNGAASYDFSDECTVLYDPSLEKAAGKLL